MPRRKSSSRSFFAKIQFKKLLKKPHVDVPKKTGTKKDEVHQPKERHKSMKHQNLPPRPRWKSEQSCSFPSSDGDSSRKGAIKTPIVDMESKIPKSMEKTPKLRDYDGNGNPYEHMQLVGDQLSYFSTGETSMYKFFELTLVEPTRLWLNGMPDACIDFWTNFCKRFFMQFTSRKQRHLTETALSGIM